MKNELKITTKSVRSLSNLRLIVIDYFVLPIFSLLLLLLIVYNSNQDYTRVVIGSVITSGIGISIGLICASLVYEQFAGIIYEIESIKPKFSKYWLPKFIVANFIGVLVTLVLGTIGLLGIKHSNLIWNIVMVLPLIIIISSLFGYICSIAGLNRDNPYWASNLFVGSLILLSGVIIPVSQYPFWLKIIAIIFPISDVLDLLTKYNSISIWLAIVAKLVFWLLVAYILTRYLGKVLK